MPQGVALRGLLALVALHRVALAGLGVGGIAKLHEYRLALARTLDRSAEKAPRPVRDGRRVTLTYELRRRPTGPFTGDPTGNMVK